MAGHIKLDRKILTWEWYQDVNTCRLFIHLLLTANWKDGRWKGYVVKRGQLITGRVKLSEETNMSERSIRTSLDKLISTNEITVKTTNKFSVVTICKYDYYQSFDSYNDQQSDQQNANKRPTERQQTTTIEESNNNNKEINNNRGAGDFASPTPPPDGFNYLPDGRSYIEPIVFYTKADFNGLPDSTNEDVRRVLKDVKEIEIESERVKSMWESFKGLELTFQKPYRNKEDVYRHFTNWMKKQPFKKPPRKPIPKNKPQEKIIGVQFLNDFTECRMSDGTIQKLEINQRDLAKYNQISPKDISKN